MGIELCRIVDLPTVTDTRGSLTFIEATQHVPFEIRRVFYLYGVSEEKGRGGHALKSCKQMLIPLSGVFDVIVDDGSTREKYHLHARNRGLYIPPCIWRELVNFSPDSVCMALASEHYSEEDYLRNFTEFLDHTRRLRV